MNRILSIFNIKRNFKPFLISRLKPIFDVSQKVIDTFFRNVKIIKTAVFYIQCNISKVHGILQYQTASLQMEYSFLHHNASKNHELLFAFQLLKIHYTLYNFLTKFCCYSEIIFEKTNYSRQYYDKTNNDPITLFDL